MKEDKTDNKKLNENQKVFCEQYVIDWNGTRSYKVAYPKEKSDHTAASCAYNLLRITEIKDYIEELKKKTAELAGISPLSQVLELKKIAYSNMSSLFDGWVSLEDFDGLTDDQKAAIVEISYSTKKMPTKTGSYVETDFVKIKLHDKLSAIREINKMLGFHAPEKSEVNMKTDQSINIILPDPSPEAQKRWDDSQIKDEG